MESKRSTIFYLLSSIFGSWFSVLVLFSCESVEGEYLARSERYRPGRRRGAVPGRLGGAQAVSGSAVVRRRQVRHLHPLRRLRGPGLQERVVPAQYVPPGVRRIRAPRRDLRPTGAVRL